ncbi:19659_t:CDS:2, partial [Dentiscutata erythropus]
MLFDENVLEFWVDHFETNDESFESASTSSSVINQNHGLLDSYLYQELKPDQIEEFKKLLLNATVENPAVKKLFKWVNSILSLPSQKQLSGHILKKSTTEISKTILDDAINDDLGITLAYNGWRNIVQQNLLGTVLFTSTNNMIIWDIKNISGKKSKSEIIINETKKSLIILSKKIKINGLITDLASENIIA